MLECCFRNIYATLFQQVISHCELCEPLAQKHVILELFENLFVEVVCM